MAIQADAGVFKALADPTRRQILQDLREGELSAGEIASRFPISNPSVSRHLTVLKSAGLVAAGAGGAGGGGPARGARLPAGCGAGAGGAPRRRWRQRGSRFYI